MIGETDGDPRYLFQRIGVARLLSDGRIVVGDRGASTVRIYDSEGHFESEVGRKGEGPGEFQYISSIAVYPPDTIAIYDSSLYRQTRILADGTLIDTQFFLGEDGRPELYLGRFSNGDTGFSWIASVRSDPSRATPDIMHMGRFGTDGRLEGRVGTATGLRRFDGDVIPFTPFLHAFMIGDSVFATDGLRPQITVFDGQGDSVRTFGLDDSPMDPGDAWALFEAELQKRDRLEVLEGLESVPRDEPVPQVAEVLLDDRDLFWLKRYDPSTDSHALGGWAGAPGGQWWIIDADGLEHAEIALPDGLILHDVREDQLVGITRDELGVERVVVYDIVRTAGTAQPS